jgi:hypothetical protein
MQNQIVKIKPGIFAPSKILLGAVGALDVGLPLFTYYQMTQGNIFAPMMMAGNSPMLALANGLTAQYWGQTKDERTHYELNGHDGTMVVSTPRNLFGIDVDLKNKKVNFLGRRKKEVFPLESIDDITVENEGRLSKIFNYGAVNLDTTVAGSGKRKKFEVPYVRDHNQKAMQLEIVADQMQPCENPEAYQEHSEEQDLTERRMLGVEVLANYTRALDDLHLMTEAHGEEYERASEVYDESKRRLDESTEKAKEFLEKEKRG